MAELTTEHTFQAEAPRVFQAIRNYAKYPDYLPGVTATKVLPAKKPQSVCQVRYDLKIIKSFFYTLDMFEEAPGRVWWTLDDSNLMKVSNGSWKLREAGSGRTHATYSLDITFKGLVPSAIVDQITKANLPALMKGFQKMIDEMPA